MIGSRKGIPFVLIPVGYPAAADVKVPDISRKPLEELIQIV